MDLKGRRASTDDLLKIILVKISLRIYWSEHAEWSFFCPCERRKRPFGIWALSLSCCIPACTFTGLKWIENVCRYRFKDGQIRGQALAQTHGSDLRARQRRVAAGAGVEKLGAVLDHQVVRPVAGMCPSTALHLVKERQAINSKGKCHSSVNNNSNNVSFPACRER